VIARDILELDDAEFDAAIESVKRRMPTPPGARLQPYEPEAVDTVPTDRYGLADPAHAYRPAWYEQAMADRVDSGCGPLNDDHRDQRRSMEGLVVAIVLGFAFIGTLAAIVF